MKKKMKKVNDTVIYKNKYYPWYYTPKMDINLVPISYYTRLQAELTLSKQFGPDVLNKGLNIIKGEDATKQGMVLGKNSFSFHGKRQQVKKYLFPAEFAFNRSKRRRFVNQMKSFISSTRGKSGRDKYLNRFFKKTYGYRNELW